MPDRPPHMPGRREILAAAAGLPLLSFGWAEMSAAASPATLPPGADGFDFLIGSWSVRHRKLRERLAGGTDWFEFTGTLDVQPILGGLGNIDENVLEDPEGTYLATSLRLFDARSGNWAIYWIDGRATGIDAPVAGRFAGPVGQFYGDNVFEGRPIRIRFTYENLGSDQARWRQAFSSDAGASWEENWIMEFARRRAGQ